MDGLQLHCHEFYSLSFHSKQTGSSHAPEVQASSLREMQIEIKPIELDLEAIRQNAVIQKCKMIGVLYF